jgi:hypothetical protein
MGASRVQALLLLVGIVLTAWSASTAGAGSTTRARAACGTELWAKKTMSDAQRNLVNLRPRDTTVAAINAVTPPRVLRRTRAPFERQVWRVAAQITESKLEADADIHLVLFDSGAYMSAEMPAAACLPARTRDRRAIINARRLFVTRCGFPSTTWHPLGAVVRISGVGFFDPHGQTGHASNYTELHPVTGLQILAGC